MTLPCQQELISSYLLRHQGILKPSAKPYIIGFLGMPGLGKTTLAKKLSEAFHLPILERDDIRRFLHSQGHSVSAHDLVEAISQATLHHYLSRKHSLILDADLIALNENLQPILKAHKATLFTIQLTCPEEVVFERIRQRNPTDADAYIAVYNERKILHQTHPLPFDFSFDSHLPSAPQFQHLAAQLKRLLNS
jgi:predicted kinase